MTYASQEEIENAAGGPTALIELTDLAGDGVLDSDVLSQAQARADSWINSYIERVHTVPLTGDDITESVRECSADETVYRLKKRRRVQTSDDRDDHQERLQWLIDVAAKRASLGTSPLPAQSSTAAAATGDRELETHSITRDKYGGIW